MNLRKAWTIARKDFAVFWQKKSILATLLAFPLGVGVGLPVVLLFVSRRQSLSFASLLPLTDSFAFFFMVSTAAVATSLGSYAIVGEKAEKSLEPLLAAPISDSDLLLGKVLAAFLPTVGSTLLGATVFMGVVDAISFPQLHSLWYPNWSIAALLLVATPLACLFCVEVDVLVSSRASDVRTAQQLGGLMALPFAVIYVLGEVHVLTLDTPTLLWISLGLLAVDLALFPVSRATFRREEILTHWR
ncbi:MAG TPA: ABC transporter permease subunit [Thermoplasmata archaeon]|nr:ABC transporter permease subunit [Thermoplasmata archaeon]